MTNPGPDEQQHIHDPSMSRVRTVESGRGIFEEKEKISASEPQESPSEDGNPEDLAGAVGAPGIDGERMIRGSFEAEKAIYSFIPDHVPHPIAWGTFADDADTHFYMCDFVDMRDDLPSLRGWAEAVSTLHLNSMGKSPTGQFGFHVTTHLANVPVNNAWNPSWTAFWTQQMEGLFDQEANAHEDRDVELDALKTAFLEVAIPRYLGPLESGARSVKPCLIHSDLWPGNVKPRSATGELCLFDACAYWGHNEADLGFSMPDTLGGSLAMSENAIEELTSTHGADRTKASIQKAADNIELPQALPDQPYSIFTSREKRWISSVASFGAMFSTLMSYIYFPAIVPMANDLGVSVNPINLTVTSYLVVAGIAPAFMGDRADQGGRRPAYILMFILALASNIGLALQDSYPGLFVLRMVQSSGASGSYGAAYGIVADITTVSERGSFVGSLIFFTNAAPSFGPVIAGVLAQKLGWRAIFWFLVVLTGAYLVVVVLFLSETQRKLVGNGSIPTLGIHRSLFDRFTRDRLVYSDESHETRSKRKHHFPNPFKCIPMLFHKGNFTIILAGSITYAVKMVLQTSLASQCIVVYDLDYLQVGLVYLPSGIGGAMASYTTGILLNKNIKKVSSEMGRDEQYRRGDDISDFPIEEARLIGAYSLIGLASLSTAGYGISLMERAHISVPLIMQFISGAATSSIFTLCGTLLTDLNPHASATVQASYNLVRCIGAGAAIASQQPLADAIGLGWCFGIFAIIMLCAGPLVILLKKRGMAWRRQGQNKASR
ncbi:related to antibiotic resistance protein [Cephalotrichum gorgonifer]|uniref:protein-ribulosamine 3-kinase n=1 Tax=Cephalotrichum gorgonifer TaxID=2041049 RepID=A0AAE8SST3_9PEZI|nr:related to antibiotic resistance protein [Cephalotrichum gorgonifer]